MGTADTHTATVDFGDGTGPQPATVDETGGAGTVSGTHTYTAGGTYTVEVCVTDDAAATTCSTADLTVGNPPNVAPVLSVDPVTGSVEEGAPLAIKGAFTDPDVGDTWTMSVDWGDATPVVTTSVTPGAVADAHVYADDGTYTVTVTVDDGTAADSQVLFGVAVTNVAPTIAAKATTDGLDARLEIDLTDPGVADVLSATVDWGDGTVDDIAPPTAGPVVSADHTYRDAGSYRVVVCGSDDDGGRTCQPVALEVTEPGRGGGSDTAGNANGEADVNGIANGNDSGVGPNDSSAGPGPAVWATLPLTGSDTAPLMLLGAGLLVGGAFLTLTGRRRRAARRLRRRPGPRPSGSRRSPERAEIDLAQPVTVIAPPSDSSGIRADRSAPANGGLRWGHPEASPPPRAAGTRSPDLCALGVGHQPPCRQRLVDRPGLVDRGTEPGGDDGRRLRVRRPEPDRRRRGLVPLLPPAPARSHPGSHPRARASKSRPTRRHQARTIPTGSAADRRSR